MSQERVILRLTIGLGMRNSAASQRSNFDVFARRFTEQHDNEKVLCERNVRENGQRIGQLGLSLCCPATKRYLEREGRGQQIGQLIRMMESQALTPKCFLKSKELRQTYECGICYEICIKPVKCKGDCSRIFCMRCVSDTRQVLDRCPNRCSSPFLVSPIPDIEVEFFCPYNPSACQVSILSVKAFNEHYRGCSFVSAQQIYLKKLQREYRCLQAHQLEFFIGSYEEMINSTCAQCKEKKLCRSFCRICQDFYCVSCRVPPCSKEGCPIGHRFDFQRIANINYICDICGISTAVSNDGVYDDSFCNFGICQACFSELPEQFDQSKPKEIIANINNQCSCGTKLVYTDSVHSRFSCQLCLKRKQCPKSCPNCQKRYCLGCKLMDIYSDSTCLMDHELVKVTMQGREEFMQRENQFGCMKCNKPNNEYYYDPHCRTRLCSICFEYSMRVTTDKERPILLKCDKNHVLMYLNEIQDFYADCCKCNKTKIIKLCCNFCEQDQRTYCFQCKSIYQPTCYYKHSLKFTKLLHPRPCHFCTINYNEFHYCRKCTFFVCKGCMETHLQANEKPLEKDKLAAQPNAMHQLFMENKDSMDIQEEV